MADEDSEFFDQHIENMTAPAPTGPVDQHTTMQELLMPHLRAPAGGGGDGGGGGHFTVMPNQIPEAIALFAQARNRMRTIANRGRWDAVVHPPGADLVSSEVAAAMTSAGLDGPQSAVGAANAAVAEFERIIEALKATGRTYGVVEEDVSRTFNG